MLTASGLMTRHPTTVQPTDLINDAALKMGTLGFGILPVVDESDSGKLLGIITDRDIVVRCTAKKHDPTTCQVRDHMTQGEIATIPEDAALSEIAELMVQLQVRRLPVVDATGNLIGVVSQADLAKQVGPVDPQLVEEVLAGVSVPAP